MEEPPELSSFITRKRPAVEALVEDLLGPTSQLDEVISSNLGFPAVVQEAEEITEDLTDQEEENEEGVFRR